MEKITRYDRINNEGGDGYNPHRDEAENRDRARWAKFDREMAATPQGRIDALQRRIRVECGSVARECGNVAEIDALENSLRVEIRAIEAQIEAEFLAEWTVATTTERREAWNTMVKSGKFGVGKIDFRAVQEQEQEQGWTMSEMKKAIKAHGL